MMSSAVVEVLRRTTCALRGTARGAAVNAKTDFTADMHRFRSNVLRQKRPSLARYGARHLVTVLPGDGIGPEMLDHVKRIVGHADAPVDFEEALLTSDVEREEEEMDNAIFSIKRNGVAIKGNIETIFDHPETKSRNVELRRRLDLYASILHCVNIPSIPSRHEGIDMIIVRENTEGEYSGLEHLAKDGVVESLKICKAIAEKEFPQLEIETMIIDNACMQLVSRPQQFDVLLMPNLYGNVISNIACGLVGGGGLLSGVNFGEKYAVFETGTRGRGNSFVGKNSANPTSYIKASVDLLSYLDLDAYSNLISDSLFIALTQRQIHTLDIGGTAKTSDLVDATIEIMDEIRDNYFK